MPKSMTSACLQGDDCNTEPDYGDMSVLKKREMDPPLAFSKIDSEGFVHECIGSICFKTKCGKCNEKPENGLCCDTKTVINGICSCPCERGYNCRTNEFCLNKLCVTELDGETCGGCGQKLINNRCCGKGINNKGICYCGTTKQCESWNHCHGNSVCCSDNRCYPFKPPSCPSGTHVI